MSTPSETEGRSLPLVALLAGLPFAGDRAALDAVRVTGVYDDSRRVQPGGLFVAVPGAREDGRRFIADALARGAVAVVGTDLPETGSAVRVEVPDVRAALAELAVRWHGLAGEGLRLVLLGVTGTNGKSTTTFMTRAILEAAGVRCALLGTMHYDLCGRAVAASNTTPGALELAACLAEAQARGAQAAVMEVSSHALDQMRTDGLRFTAAAFTNLSGDHLDYHGTMERYCAAKARLFTRLSAEAVAVVNRDDPYHQEMLRDCPARVLTVAIEHAADVRATIIGSSSAGTTYRLAGESREVTVESALVGRHNVYNALGAAGLARAAGASWDAVVAGLTALRAVPGRLQRVPCACPADVFVDYAHSDDALRNVLGALRPLTRGRLRVVFGCGGDRDRTKRPRMARVAAELADELFVTSDNPRSEDPEAIIAEILTGLTAADRTRTRVDVDRARAIRAALADARRGDVVLIAGKGHETYQIIGSERIHFDDAEVAMAVVPALEPVAGEKK